MDARSFSGPVLLSCALLLVTGCPRTAPPENAVTWGVKATRGQLTTATPTEWQAIAEKIDARTPEVDVSLSDAQAAAIVEFVQVNDLDSIEEITDFVEGAQSDPSEFEEVVIPDSVMELFADGDFESFTDAFLSESGD